MLYNTLLETDKVNKTCYQEQSYCCGNTKIHPERLTQIKIYIDKTNSPTHRKKHIQAENDRKRNKH